MALSKIKENNKWGLQGYSLHGLVNVMDLWFNGEFAPIQKLEAHLKTGFLTISGFVELEVLV